MDFIIDNYLWFGILGVVLLMALIGFLAEKTNFIKADNTSKPEKKKKEKKTDVVTPTPVEAPVQPPLDALTNQNVVTPEVEKTVPAVEPKVNKKEEVTAPAPVVPKKETEVLQVDSVMTEKGEDLTQPFGDKTVKAPVQNAPKKTVTEQEEEDVWKF